MKEFVAIVVMLVTVFAMIMVSMTSQYVQQVCESANATIDAIKTKYTLEEVMIKTNGEAAGW